MDEASDHQLVDCRSMRHLSHDHVLALVAEQREGYDRICLMCDKSIQGSNCYCCTESGCKFFLHKFCAELPPHIDLPFLHRHSLQLKKKPAAALCHYFCCICYDHCEIFYYCFDCNFAVDVKCSLLLQSEVETFSHHHPLILATKTKFLVNVYSCFGCEESTPGPIYSCVRCNFYLHKKCAELPPTITHPSHRKHLLSLSTNTTRPFHGKLCTCLICSNRSKGFIYHCSLCKFDLKIKHTFSSQVEIGSHEHPFNRILKPMTFICDACGTDGDCIPYICSTCNLAIHKDCTLVPKVIKLFRHIHPISHTCFLSEHESERRDCKICLAQVNIDHGSYYCSGCKYIAHVHCALNPLLLEAQVKEAIHEETSVSLLGDESETSAVDVTSIEIKHFNHRHNLKLGDQEMKNDGYKYCDGCVRPISTDHPFYFCEQCDFFLHKSCAKLPMKTVSLFYPNKVSLMPYAIFICWNCKLYSSGFSYFIETYKGSICLRCSLSDTFEHQGHQHPLFFDLNYERNCSACGYRTFAGYRCQYCNFSMCLTCTSLPNTTQHKDHIHPLAITSHDGDDPSQYYCDICEEERDPSHWFYSCPDCDFTAHVFCTLGGYPFIKRGIKFRHKDHPHQLVTVQKAYYYPLCIECGNPCLDLAVECEISECNYICHLRCLQFPLFFPITGSYNSETCK